MINFIVFGKNKQLVAPVLQSIRSFTDAKSIVIGGRGTSSLRWSSLCRQQVSIKMDGSEDDAFVAMVNGIVEKIHHVTLIPVDCDAIRMTNRVRDRLALNISPIPITPTLDMLDDKWRFHQFCKQNLLAVPLTRMCASKAELEFSELASAFGLPFVVKPTNQAGSHGVKVINSKAELEKEILHNAAYLHAPLLAQQFIDGPDIDISLLSDRGQISAVAVQQAYRGNVRFVECAGLEDMAARLCHASAYTGVMHIDARIDRRSGKIFLLESNPRFWASLTASVACGLNFVAETIHPTPRRGGMRHLRAGTACMRHPLLRPSTWPSMLSDAGDYGRLLRATMFDLYGGGNFLKQLPSALVASVSKPVMLHKLPGMKKMNDFLRMEFTGNKRLTKS